MTPILRSHFITSKVEIPFTSRHSQLLEKLLRITTQINNSRLLGLERVYPRLEESVTNSMSTLILQTLIAIVLLVLLPPTELAFPLYNCMDRPILLLAFDTSRNSLKSNYQFNLILSQHRYDFFKCFNV